MGRNNVWLLGLLLLIFPVATHADLGSGNMTSPCIGCVQCLVFCFLRGRRLSQLKECKQSWEVLQLLLFKKVQHTEKPNKKGVFNCILCIQANHHAHSAAFWQERQLTMCVFVLHCSSHQQHNDGKHHYCRFWRDHNDAASHRNTLSSPTDCQQDSGSNNHCCSRQAACGCDTGQFHCSDCGCW